MLLQPVVKMMKMNKKIMQRKRKRRKKIRLQKIKVKSKS